MHHVGHNLQCVITTWVCVLFVGPSAGAGLPVSVIMLGLMLWQLGITPWSTRCNAMLQAYDLTQKMDHPTDSVGFQGSLTWQNQPRWQIQSFPTYQPTNQCQFTTGLWSLIPLAHKIKDIANSRTKKPSSQNKKPVSEFCFTPWLYLRHGAFKTQRAKKALPIIIKT